MYRLVAALSVSGFVAGVAGCVSDNPVDFRPNLLPSEVPEFVTSAMNTDAWTDGVIVCPSFLAGNILRDPHSREDQKSTNEIYGWSYSPEYYYHTDGTLADGTEAATTPRVFKIALVNTRADWPLNSQKKISLKNRWVLKPVFVVVSTTDKNSIQQIKVGGSVLGEFQSGGLKSVESESFKALGKRTSSAFAVTGLYDSELLPNSLAVFDIEVTPKNQCGLVITLHVDGGGMSGSQPSTEAQLRDCSNGACPVWVTSKPEDGTTIVVTTPACE